MKAFLLAGGLGERLRPLTDRVPKCLVSINGVPLLAIWLDLCTRSGIDSVLINILRHGDAVEEFLHSEDLPIDVRVVREKEPVGNAGSVLANRDFVRGEDNFYILYADNLTDASLPRLLAFHQAHDGPLTMGLFRTTTPMSAGIVDLAPDGRVLLFEEKPEQPMGNLANAGIYVCRQTVFDAIPTNRSIVDFGKDVFPRLAGQVYGQLVDGYLLDIGTPDALAKGCNDWASRTRAQDRSPAFLGESVVIISRTPFRVSLVVRRLRFAAVTYHARPGSVVAMAINRYMYVTVNKRFDSSIRVSYTKTEIVRRVDDLEHDLIREAMKMVGITGGVEVTTIADLPAGIGLASSSTVTVGVLNALYAFQGRHVSAEELARQACDIEIDVLGKPIGKQDQYIAAYGGFQHVRFNPDETVEVNPIICSKEASQSIMRRLLALLHGDAALGWLRSSARQTAHQLERATSRSPWTNSCGCRRSSVANSYATKRSNSATFSTARGS